MKKVPQKSFQNIVILLIFAIGLFILYRYVKSLENDVKALHKNVETLTNKVMNLQVCSPPTKPQKEIIKDDEDDDDDSIKHEDIHNMLKSVLNISDEDDDDTLENDEEIINDKTPVNEDTLENDEEIVNDKLENDDLSESKEIPTNETLNDSHVIDIDDDIQLKPTLSKDSLMRKTNDELKKLLKDMNLNTKGTKAELVDRILAK
jgi:hypothetical protein